MLQNWKLNFHNWENQTPFFNVILRISISCHANPKIDEQMPPLGGSHNKNRYTHTRSLIPMISPLSILIWKVSLIKIIKKLTKSILFQV